MSTNSVIPQETVYTEPQQAFMPQSLITETPINTAGGGPYYVFSPGLTFHGLRNMVTIFSKIPGGEIFKVESGHTWVSAGQLPEGSATKLRVIKDPIFGREIDRHHRRDIPAEDTLNALLGDRSLTQNGLVRIPQFDSQSIELAAFNYLVRPEELDFSEKRYPTNPQWKKIAEQDGILMLRRIWLEEALNKLQTGQYLEDIRRLTDAKPYLLELWIESLEKILIPANETYKTIADGQLSAIEEKIRSEEIKQYDPFAFQLMWLLGRKPERTALSRTLETAGKMNSGGLTAEDLGSILKALQQPNNTQQSAVETVSCPDCGNRCEMVAGGPPRICWRCRYEFREMSVESVAVQQPTESVQEVSVVEQTDEPQNTDVSEIARKILEQNKVR